MFEAQTGERHNQHLIVTFSPMKIGNRTTQMVFGECLFCHAALRKSSAEAMQAQQWDNTIQKWTEPWPCIGGVRPHRPKGM